MSNDWWQITVVFLLATIKYVFGSIPLSIGFGFSFQQLVLVNTLGGITGSIIFTKLGTIIFARIKKNKKAPDPSKKKFTRSNKIIIKVKRSFGLAGIAVISPLLLSIPVGCILASRYYKNKNRIILFMTCSVFFWALLIGAYKLFI